MCSTTLPSSSRTFNTSSQPIGTQVPVHPTSAELPTLQPNRYVHKYPCIQHFNPTDRQAQKYLCGQHAQNFEHFIPTDRHTSTCASNIRRTSNSSTQPIGRHKITCVANMRRTSNTSTQPIGRHTSTCLANFSEGKRILTHKCKHNLPEYLRTSVNTTCPTQLPTYSDRLYEQQFSLNLHLYNIVLPPLVTTVFTTKPTGGHTRKPASLDG